MKSKIIRITANLGAETFGNGAYSLSERASKEDFSRKIFVDCNMDEMDLQRTVKELKEELNNCKKEG